jgi:hypothetical protein
VVPGGSADADFAHAPHAPSTIATIHITPIATLVLQLATPVLLLCFILPPGQFRSCVQVTGPWTILLG